jgi:hypothetical protein
MNHFHIWCNLKPGESDVRFGESTREFLGWLHERELIEAYQILRRGFTIDPPGLGEFLIVVDLADLDQMNRAFDRVAARGDDIEPLYEPVWSALNNLHVALYRDWPPLKKFNRPIREMKP